MEPFYNKNQFKNFDNSIENLQSFYQSGLNE